MKRARLAVCAALALGALACANHTTLTETPPPTSGPRREAIPRPLVIDWIEKRKNGFETNPSTDFIVACAEVLRSSRTFSEVYEPRRAHAAPTGGFHLAIRFEEDLDKRTPAAAAKLIAIVFTSGLAAGLPFYFDDRVLVEGELRSPGGEIRRYRSSAAGTIRSFALFGLANAEHELRSRIAGEAFRSFAAAITTDTTLAEGR